MTFGSHLLANTAGFECPACGSDVVGVSALTRSLECPHCGNWVYLDNQSWVAGSSFEHEITAPPFLQVGKTGALDGKPFSVTGRLRLKYPAGAWDEWWLEFESGAGHWLEEDDGSYYLHLEQLIDRESDSLQDVLPGQLLSSSGTHWFVTEKIQAQILGAQGQLPVSVIPGTPLTCIDAVAGGRELSLEVWPEGAIASISEKVSSRRLVWFQ